MYTLLVLTVLAQPEKPDAPTGQAPTQMVAGIDSRGTLRLTFATPSYGGCYGGWGSGPSMPPPSPPGVTPAKAPAPPKVKVTTVTVTTAELAAKHAQAYTADGRTIPAERLAALLAKERPVLVALDGKKVDPFYLQLYKDDTLILVLPANTLNVGWGGAGVVAAPATYGAFPEKMPRPLPPDTKPLPDGRKP